MNDFPSMKKIMLRVKDHEEESNHKTYQGVDLTYFDRGLTFLQNHFSKYIESVLSCMHSRLKPHENPQDKDVLNHTLKLLPLMDGRKQKTFRLAMRRLNF